MRIWQDEKYKFFMHLFTIWIVVPLSDEALDVVVLYDRLGAALGYGF